MKPGWKTTEFWITVTTVLGIAGSVLAGISAPWAAPVAGVVAAAYAVSRAIAKAKSIDTQPTLGAVSTEEVTPTDRPRK